VLTARLVMRILIVTGTGRGQHDHNRRCASAASLLQRRSRSGSWSNRGVALQGRGGSLLDGKRELRSCFSIDQRARARRESPARVRSKGVPLSYPPARRMSGCSKACKARMVDTGGGFGVVIVSTPSFVATSSRRCGKARNAADPGQSSPARPPASFARGGGSGGVAKVVGPARADQTA